MQYKSKKGMGFTLIELLIVVAIIAILAAVAYPSYNELVLRGRRAEGRALLLDAAARLEGFFSNNNVYATAANTWPLPGGTTSENNLYTLTIGTTGTFQTYTLTATPTFVDNDCGNLTFTQDGTRGIAGVNNINANITNDCWGR